MFFNGRSLFTINRKVDMCFVPMYMYVVCYCSFDTVFNFIVNLNIKKFLKFTSKHCKLI